MKFFKDWLEDRRIKTGLRQYASIKTEKPNVSEEAICKELLIGRILSTRAKEWGLKSVEDAEHALKKLNAEYNNIEDALAWIIINEDRGRYSIFGDNALKIKPHKDFFNSHDKISKEKQLLKGRILKIREKLNI